MTGTSIPSRMIAVEITEPGGPGVLLPAQREVPAPAPGEVLVAVEAAGVNRPDVMQRQGLYPPPPGASDLPGLEIAGTVVALGDGVDTPALGARVCALVTGGGYAEYCTAAAPLCLPVPAGFDAAQAAALPETFFTVWTNVFDRAGLGEGESILVHGGSSGIGTTAIQLARAFGATAYVTAGSKAKCDACLALGADAAIDYREEDFVERIGAITGGRGVDVVLDMIAGDYLPRNLKCLATEGRLVIIAVQHGPKVERLERAADHAEATDGDRLHAPPPHRRAEGGDCARAATQGVAVARSGRGQADRARTIPARRRVRRPPADGERRARREDRAGDVIVRRRGRRMRRGSGVGRGAGTAPRSLASRHGATRRRHSRCGYLRAIAVRSIASRGS